MTEKLEILLVEDDTEACKKFVEHIDELETMTLIGVTNNADKALEYIKNYLGDIHTTVGVGNYENDLPLLEHADIAATPASGLQLLQKEADILLPICNEGAVRSLIEHLDHKNQ